MPSILSKIFAGTLSHDLSCHETYHTWTPSCTEASTGLFFSFFQKSFKIYIILYVFNQVALKKKLKVRDFVTSLENATRSSFFMGFTPFMSLSVYCWLRHSSDKFYYWSQLYIPQILGCLLGIQIESPSRREALTVFSKNVASETVYRILLENTGMKPIHGGSLFLFATAMLMFVHSYERTKKIGMDSKEYRKGFQASVMEFLLNNHEGQELCSHEHFVKDCLMSACKAAAMTFGATGLIHYILMIFNGSPLSVGGTMFRRTTFFAAFVALFRVSNCSQRCYRLHHQRNLEAGSQGSSSCIKSYGLSDSEISLLSGMIASIAITIHSDNSITLYLFWKSFQLLLACYVKPSNRKTLNLVFFVLSCSQIFHSMTMHQHLIRRGYFSFIDKLSGGRIREFNKPSFDFFRHKDSFADNSRRLKFYAGIKGKS